MNFLYSEVTAVRGHSPLPNGTSEHYVLITACTKSGHTIHLQSLTNSCIPGDKLECKNYRRISTPSISAKVYRRINIQRVVDETRMTGEQKCSIR